MSDVIPPEVRVGESLTERPFVRCRARARLSISILAAGLLSPLSGVTWAQGPTSPAGAKTMLIEPPTPLLPATLGQMKRAEAGDAGDGLSQVDGADSAVLTEDGLKRFARSDYINSNGNGSGVLATVYQFRDASGAVAAYGYFARPNMRPEKLGDEAIANGDDILFRSGVSVVRASFQKQADRKNALMDELIGSLPKVGGTSALVPPLPAFLPAKGLDVSSVKYALGPADYQATGGVLRAETVGFDKSAETVTAKYKDAGVLTLIEYPTPAIAGEHERTIATELNQTGSAAGVAKLRREGPLLMVATGAWKPADAISLIDGIHLRDELTWNKQMPLEFHAEVQKTYSLLVSIAILCGVGALAAIVLGLFLGGGRALIRVLQGKPAATEPEFLRIDLRGRSAKKLGLPDA
jgi:hypothetical protein